MPARILVRLPNWLGDLLMSRPLLHALRAAPGTGDVWAVGTPASRLLDREQVWSRWFSIPESIRASLGPLAGAHFEAAIVLPPSFSSAWSLRSIDAARRIGFAADLRSWLLTDAVRRPGRGEMHLTDEYLRLGALLGCAPVALPELQPSGEERQRAQERLRGLGVVGEPVAILGPGAAYGPAKRWPGERFVELGRRLAAAGHRVLVAGVAADRPLSAAVSAGIGSRAAAVAGETSLEEQLALCALAAVVVSNDSGLAHLAAAAGTPTVVLFGSTSSAWTAPLGPRVAVVQRAPVCSPCFRRTCRIGYRCLEAIEVDAVERACRQVAA